MSEAVITAALTSPIATKEDNPALPGEPGGDRVLHSWSVGRRCGDHPAGRLRLASDGIGRANRAKKAIGVGNGR